MLRPCEVLIRKNAEIEWAENQIKERSEKLLDFYNGLIGRGLDPRIAEEELRKDMEKVCNHFLPLYIRSPVSHIMFDFQLIEPC